MLVAEAVVAVAAVAVVGVASVAVAGVASAAERAAVFATMPLAVQSVFWFAATVGWQQVVAYLYGID